MFTMAAAVRVVTDWVGDPGAVVEYGVRFSRPVVVPDDDRGATIEVTGTVAEKLDGDRVRVELTARSDGRRCSPGPARGPAELTRSARTFPPAGSFAGR